MKKDDVQSVELRSYDRAADYLLEAAQSSNSDVIAKALAYHAAAIRKGDFKCTLII